VSFIVTIDGPAGAGKSTVARRLANLLDFTYLDTGAMYRSVAWAARQCSVDISDHDALITMARATTIEFGILSQDGKQTIHVNGVDVTADIRTPEVSALTSTIAVVGSIRTIVVEQQRNIAGAARVGVVLEGRDTGTVVFPGAQLKVFLTASAEERARRRTEELSARGVTASYDAILQDQLERDLRDSTRAVSPLVPASDAVHVSTDSKTVDQVVEEILALQRGRGETREAAGEPGK
jgi:cytidylate kinase